MCNRLRLLFYCKNLIQGGGCSEEEKGKALFINNLKEVIRISRSCPLNSK
nr:MAG TPA: hypothetical protein [Caudoviricetes sp.]